MRRVHGRRVRVEGLGSVGFRVSAGCLILAAFVLSVRGWEEADSRLFFPLCLYDVGLSELCWSLLCTLSGLAV